MPAACTFHFQGSSVFTGTPKPLPVSTGPSRTKCHRLGSLNSTFSSRFWRSKFKVPGGLMSSSGLHADDHLHWVHTQPSRCTNVERLSLPSHLQTEVALGGFRLQPRMLRGVYLSAAPCTKNERCAGHTMPCGPLPAVPASGHGPLAVLPGSRVRLRCGLLHMADCALPLPPDLSSRFQGLTADNGKAPWGRCHTGRSPGP